MSSPARAASARSGGSIEGAGRAAVEACDHLLPLPQEAQIWLLTVFGKDEAADLTAREKRLLKAALDEEKRQRTKRRVARRQ